MIGQSIGTLLERCARYYGDRTALIQNGSEYSYEEVFRRIRATGSGLLQTGLRPGDRIALLMDDSPELVALYFGALWAGLVVVPLNSRLGSGDHRHIVGDSGARALCFDQPHREHAALVAEAVELELLFAAGDAGEELAAVSLADVEAAGGRGRAAATASDQICLIPYTGGTTGRPKGVVHTHDTLVATMLSETVEAGLSRREVFAHVAPLIHASGLFMLPVWMRGGTNLVLGGFDPEALLDAIDRHGVTTTFVVPTMLYVLLDLIGDRDMRDSTLETVIYGAAPITPSRLEQALATFGQVFVQFYGQTEAPNQLTVLDKGDHARALAEGDLRRLLSCGRPVAIADVRVDAAAGGRGEVLARGPHLMRGYWGNEAETEKALAGGWLHTGDVAEVDDEGYLYLVDRVKDMIVTGGYNVYPKEVEQTLTEHPAVADACVVGVPDPKWGEAVLAVVVLRDGAEAAAADLAAFVKDRKGGVHTPKRVELRDELPLTALGKVDKKALRAEFWGEGPRSVQ